MLSPSGNIFTHIVTINKYVYVLDADRARRRDDAQTTAYTYVPASVLPGAPTRTVTEGRVDTVTPYEVQFVRDYGLEAEDEITWVDGARTHKIVVAGVVPGAGRGQYVVSGMERT